MMKNVLCIKCKWVHFEVSRQKAEDEVDTFNKYFDSLDKEKQEEFYGGVGSSIKNYEHCFCCQGSYKNFREANDDEIPYGSTIQPIINREE